VASAGSSSSDLSGRTTFMTEPGKDTHPREDDRNEETDESPTPDPTEGEPIAEDDPEAD